MLKEFKKKQILGKAVGKGKGGVQSDNSFNRDIKDSQNPKSVRANIDKKLPDMMTPEQIAAQNGYQIVPGVVSTVKLPGSNQSSNSSNQSN